MTVQIKPCDVWLRIFKALRGLFFEASKWDETVSLDSWGNNYEAKAFAETEQTLDDYYAHALDNNILTREQLQVVFAPWHRFSEYVTTDSKRVKSQYVAGFINGLAMVSSEMEALSS